MKVTKRAFRKLNIYTIIAVYFLILVGGIVRSTGSGMGCPDWPKCFGSIVPPTSEDQLPDDYQAYYLQKRIEKNGKIAKMINGFGFTSLANEISNDPSIFEEEPFNATKTWIEYVNRLIGVVIGLLIFAVLVASLFLWNSDRKMFYWSLFAFILVAFQGWFGSIVVSTNLLPGTISVHMGLALLLVCVLIYMVYINRDQAGNSTNSSGNGSLLLSNLMLTGMLLFVVQIFLGTQVRESIDLIAKEIADRSLWVDELGLSFYIHRTYSLLILGLHIWMVYLLKKYKDFDNSLNLMFKTLVVLIILEVLSGALMAYFAIPGFLQPLHLLVATLIFGVQFYAYLNLKLLSSSKRILTS
ncbi:MAG: COX15/CtaA family protein [Bacteroidota bacterium]